MLFIFFNPTNKAYSKIIEFTKCFEHLDHQQAKISKENLKKWKEEGVSDDSILVKVAKDDLDYRDKRWQWKTHTWSVNTSTGKITNILEYSDEYEKKYGDKEWYPEDLMVDFDLYNFTKSLIIGRHYLDDEALRELLINPNDRTIIHYEIVIDRENKEVHRTSLPNGPDDWDLYKLSKMMDKSISEAKEFFSGRKDSWRCKGYPGKKETRGN